MICPPGSGDDCANPPLWRYPDLGYGRLMQTRRLAVPLVCFSLLLGCGGADSSMGDPGMAGTWAMDYRYFTGTHCTGTMVLTAAGAGFTGTIDVGSCGAGTISGVTMGWNGSSGQLSGTFTDIKGGTTVIYEGLYDAHAAAFKQGSTPSPANFIGSYTGTR
jgi:hypothetical protein